MWLKYTENVDIAGGCVATELTMLKNPRLTSVFAPHLEVA
jgi:hypothetical protein